MEGESASLRLCRKLAELKILTVTWEKNKKKILHSELNQIEEGIEDLLSTESMVGLSRYK
jgi:hypothetical protein